MAEIWGAAIAVGGAVISGMAAKKKADADRKANREDSEAMTKEESELSAQRTGYETALERFFVQQDRFDKQRGLDQFRKFSTMGNFAPGYTDDEARIAAPVMPNYNDFAIEQEEVIEEGGGGGGSKSIFDKRVDLHTKPLSAIKKLF